MSAADTVSRPNVAWSGTLLLAIRAFAHGIEDIRQGPDGVLFEDLGQRV